jgi:MFS family permease
MQNDPRPDTPTSAAPMPDAGTAAAAPHPGTAATDTPGSDEAATERPRLGGAFWRLWTSSGLSNLADGVAKIALPLIAVQFTRSPTLIAGLTFALTLPWLLFALPAGVLADRLDRRRAMIGANLVRASLFGALALAVFTDVASIWVLYLVALGIGVAETIYDTSAQSILPQIVPRPLLSRANGRLYAVEMTANEFVGPPLGGFLVAAGAVFAVAAPGGLWVVALVALLLVPGRFRVERHEPTTMRADVVEGLRFLWRQRVLRTLAFMVGGFNFASNGAFALLVLYAVGPASPMGLSEPAFGLLLTSVAIGSLIGSFLAEKVEARLGRARSLTLGFLAGALSVAVPGLSSDPYVVAAGFFIGGIGIVVANVVSVSLRQTITPDRLLGRVNSGYRLLAWGSRPLGAVTGGLLAEAFGLRPVFLIMAGVTLVLILGMRIVTDAAMQAAEHDADHA